MQYVLMTALALMIALGWAAGESAVHQVKQAQAAQAAQIDKVFASIDQ